jgi:hypothetical protein
VVTIAISSAILFYGMKFAPPIAIDGASVAAGKT